MHVMTVRWPPPVRSKEGHLPRHNSGTTRGMNKIEVSLAQKIKMHPITFLDIPILFYPWTTVPRVHFFRRSIEAAG